MKDFQPVINQRLTKDLLNIVAAPENWDLDAVNQAKSELNHRQISSQEIENAIQCHQQETKNEILKRANESYSILDFVFNPSSTILEITISWELKKDGFLRKAKQQKWFRLIFLMIILLIIFLSTN